MCLQTTWKAPKKASKDITVYKLLIKNTNKIATSPYEGFYYSLGTLYETKMGNVGEQSGSFDTLSSDAVLMSNVKLKSIAEGFHSALELSRFDDTDDDKFKEQKYECIIPKGSLYYKGLTGLVVSNQIIIKKLIK